MTPLEKRLRGIFEQHGFVLASELMDLSKTSPRKIRAMIDSWKNYPKCMEIYPNVLSKKDNSYWEGEINGRI